MTTTYLVISLLKQSIIPHKQLTILLSYLPIELLLEYLPLANVYDGSKQISKSVLVNLIVDDKDPFENAYTEKDSELTIHEIKKLLSRNRGYVMLNN